MESSKLTKEQMADALCEVRKAHRLVYEYQVRMMDLVRFIGWKIDMTRTPTISKRFSNLPKSKLFEDMWAWDFIYTYQMEYDFGEKEIGDYVCHISVLQIVDTGYFDIPFESHEIRKHPEKFSKEIESASKLFFYLNRRQNGTQSKCLDNRASIFDDNKYMCKDFEKEVKEFKEYNEKELLYSFPLERFLDKESTSEALQEFADYCQKEVDVLLTIQK